MLILSSPSETGKLCARWRANGSRVALVPTMGFFHAGHESLMKLGKNAADKLVVSLFVNPAQFGPGEDLEKYPRNLERDAAIAEKNGCDLLFAPTPRDMYADDHHTWVEVPELARGLCGASRPGHFRGVCTVVLKLLMITHPDVAVFGRKDWQQQAIIRMMCRDLNIPVEILSAPIAREEDGLALSSRNVYLSPGERAIAPHIHRGLETAADLLARGEKDVGRLKEAALAYWESNLPGCEVEYASVVHPETLETLPVVTGSALLACAIRLGSTRLIDNIELNIS